MNSNIMNKNQNRKLTFFAIVFVVLALCVGLLSAQLNLTLPADAEESGPVSVWDGSSDMSWFSHSTNTFTLTSAAQLRGLADMAINGFDFSPYTIKLGTNVDLNGLDWKPFKNYAGTFDGQGHYISNGKIVVSDSNGTGFFGLLNKVTNIKNLTFKNMDVRSKVLVRMAIVAGGNTADGTTFSNVNVKNSFVFSSPYGNASEGPYYGPNYSSDNYIAAFVPQSTAAIKFENCGIYDTMICGGYASAGFVASVSGGAYNSKIVGCKVMNTVYISPANSIGVLIYEGDNRTDLENNYSNIYPTPIAFEGAMRAKFTQEQQTVYDSVTETVGGVLKYGYRNKTDSIGIVDKIMLGSEDLSSNFYGKTDLYLSATEANAFTVSTKIPCDVSITLDGVTTSENTTSLTVNLSEGAHAISFSVSYDGTVCTSGSVISGLDNVLKVYDSDSVEVANSEQFISKDGFEIRVSEFKSGYTLKKTYDINGVTFKVNGAALTADGTAFESKNGMYMIPIEVGFGDHTTTFNYVVYTGLRISMDGAYPWTYVAEGDYYKSTNQKKGSSQSDIVFTVFPGYKLSFDYACSSENNWDYMFFNVNGADAGNTNGANCALETDAAVLADSSVWKTYEYENNSSEAAIIRLYYKKDSSGDKGSDTAYVRNVTATALTTATQANLASYADESGSETEVITLPSDAIKLTDKIYYKYEGEATLPYDEKRGWFVYDNSTEVKNSSITIYILDSDYLTFEYANCAWDTDVISKACFDNGTIMDLRGTGNGSGYKTDGYFTQYTYKFDSVGTHKIRFDHLDTYYGWALRNFKVAVDVPLNVNVSIIGEGAAYDLVDFNNALIDENYTKSVFSKLQLLGKTEVGSDYLFYGYRIMGSDGSYGDLIKSNGDVIEIAAEDISIQLEFRRILPLENLEYTFNKDGVSESGTAYHYGTRVFNTPQENAEYILQAPIVSGATVMITDSAVDGSITPETDNGKYFYKITDFSKSHIVKFIYNKDGYGTTMLMTTLEYSPLIEEYLVSSESLPVTVINDDENFPFVYSEELSSTDKITYKSSLSKANTHKMGSNVGLKVTGTGVLVFDYYVSTQRRVARDDLKADSWLLWQKEFTGDKAMYGINTKVDFDSLTEAEIDSSLTDKVGYMGQELGSTDYYSTCTGKIGWKRATIPVSGGADEETIVYLAYVKDVDDVNGEDELRTDIYDDSEDTFAIANVMFVSGDSTVTFSSNSSTATVTASSDAEANITSGATIAAGSKVTFTVSNTDSSAKFVGWVNSDGTVLSHDTTYSRYVTDDIEIKAMFANATAAYFVEGNLFSTLNEAIESLKDGSVYRTATIVLYADSTINNDVVIPENVTLLLPFAKDDESGLKLGDRIYDRVSWNRGINPFVTLTVSTGVTLTVNGNLKIGAVQHTYEQTAQGMTSGDYAQLVNNGNVVLNGFMDVRGRVMGNGTLTVNNGATLKEPFLVNDFSGGTNTYELYTSGQFPFNQFATVNIACKQVVNYGGKVIGTTALYFWKSITTQDVVLIDAIENRDAADAVGSLIWTHIGSRLEITYDIDKCVNRTYGAGAKGFTIHLGDSGLTTIDVYGEITAGEFSLQGYGSKTMVLAIPYTYNFNVKNGGIVNVIQKYKIMPGAVVTVENGGTINISENGGLYVYDGLIQAVRDNKQYPQAADLAQYGFSKSGMFIVDGVLNIDGIFAGTIQTDGYGVINVGSGATVGEQTIIDGSSSGYREESSPNKTVFTMNGRVYDINGYVQLEKGKTYKAFSADGFVYDTFSVISAERVSTKSVAMNQAMKGRFLEYDGSNYIADITFTFPTELNGKIVVINGNNYEIVDGKVTVTGLTIGEDKKVTYRMSGIESEKISHEHVVTAGENTFDKLALSVALSESNVYEKVFVADGSVANDYVLKAVITYSDGTEVSYDLAFDAFTTYVKENAALTSEYISADVTLNHTLTVVKQALVAYIANAESLKTSANIVNDAKNVYAEYRTLTTGLSAEDLAFVNGKIGSLQNYADSIVTGIALKNGVVATYGDAETTANATMIDGSNKDVIVSLSGYAFASGDITAIATYAGNYTIDYAVTATFGGVSKKVVTLTVTGDGSYVYDGTEKAVAVTINGKVDGDNVTVNTIALIDVGTETVTFALSGDDNIFYLLSADTVSSATITITAKEVELVWTGNEFTYNGSEQKPEVRFADGRIVDGDDVSLSVTSQVNVGAYTATATLVGSKSANYSLKNPTFAYTIAQKPVTVRVADHNDVSENETSRILFTAVCEDDLGGYSFIITKDGVEVATVAADGKVTLKEGQTLSVGTYKVKAVSDNANYEVTSEENEFNIVEPNAYYTVDFGVSEDGKTYDGTATVFNVTAKVTDTNEVVNEIVVTITKDGIEVDSVVSAGRYTVTAKVGSDEVVYTKVFVVSKRTLTVAIDDINTVYGTPAEISYKITLGSIVNGDENVYSVAIDGAHANAGEYNIVGTVTDGNYAVMFVSSKSADRNYGIYTVAKKNVTLVWTGSEFTYNGSKQSPEAKLAEGSVIGSDELTVSVSDGNTTKGDYVATATLDGAAKGNYELTNATYSYVIKARSIKLNVADAESMYGNEVTFGVALVTPEDENELCGVSKNEIVRVACAVSKTSAAGTYDITLEVINENFIVNYEKGTYTVTKRGITVTVVAASSIYGEALATISGEVKEGSIVNGDENVYTLSKKGESLDEGKYEVVLTVNNDSYVAKIDNESVRYTIKPREITVKISDVGTTYGDNEASFVYSLNEGSSLGYNDSLDSVIRVSREAGNAAGKYAITAEGINHNYDVTFEYSDKANKRSYYYINKRGITLNVNDIEVDYKKSYEEVAEKFGYEIEGTLVGDDELTVTYAIYFGDRQATADNYATLVRGGTHTVKAVAVNANYEITVNDGVFTVTKPKITVKNVGTSFVYDDGKQIKAFDWQKNVEGFLASATESSVKATFRKIVDGTVENEPMGAITDAGTYRMTIVIVHTDAYVFDDAAVTEYDITVEKKDISSDIAVIGRSESGTYVQRRGIQIYAKLNEYEDKDLTLNSTLTFNGEAVESPYEVGEYVFTATIDDANYCGESVYSFRIMASVAKKVSDLSALIEGYNAEGTSSERFDAIMAMREIAVSFTDDDLTQIADDAAYAEVVNQYVALYKNYLDDTKKDVEVAQKVASNVLFDMMAALTDIAVAFWFGKANRG